MKNFTEEDRVQSPKGHTLERTELLKHFREDRIDDKLHRRQSTILKQDTPRKRQRADTHTSKKTEEMKPFRECLQTEK
jgi:hypothetical protein